MKFYYFLCFVSFSYLQGFAQDSFRINSTINHSIPLKINGKAYTIGKDFTEIAVSNEAFYELVFLNRKSDSSKITLCNFKPNTDYSIIIACCATLDIVPSSKINDQLKSWWNNDTDDNFYEIQNHLLDKPELYFDILNLDHDFIYGWNMDWSCTPEIVKLTGGLQHYGVPIKCYYWTNMNTVSFFKASKEAFNFGEDMLPDYEKIEVLKHINFRIFDNNSYVITYNMRLDTISIKQKK